MSIPRERWIDWLWRIHEITKVEPDPGDPDPGRCHSFATDVIRNASARLGRPPNIPLRPEEEVVDHLKELRRRRGIDEMRSPPDVLDRLYHMLADPENPIPADEREDPVIQGNTLVRVLDKAFWVGGAHAP